MIFLRKIMGYFGGLFSRETTPDPITLYVDDVLTFVTIEQDFFDYLNQDPCESEDAMRGLEEKLGVAKQCAWDYRWNLAALAGTKGLPQAYQKVRKDLEEAST